MTAKRFFLLTTSKTSFFLTPEWYLIQSRLSTATAVRGRMCGRNDISVPQKVIVTSTAQRRISKLQVFFLSQEIKTPSCPSKGEKWKCIGNKCCWWMDERLQSGQKKIQSMPEDRRATNCGGSRVHRSGLGFSYIWHKEVNNFFYFYCIIFTALQCVEMTPTSRKAFPNMSQI